jgi:localization factor PodJL
MRRRNTGSPTFYEKGSGLERDLAAAKKWYQMAAEQGNASAMHNLAVLYATAGPAPDFGNAAEWFGRAAEVGVRDSQVNLAILYARGDGVVRDLGQSYKWFAIAANDGDKDAAVKRDEVFNALRPEQVEAARASVANWTAQPIIPEANAVEVPAAWSGESTETAAVDMSKAVRNIQAILNNNGFDAGTPDGVMGKRTAAAIKAFQTSIGLEPTGEIDDRLVEELLARNG